MKATIINIIIICLALSCSSADTEQKTPKGKNSIPFDTLELILCDIHIADGITTTNIFQKENLKESFDSLVYQSVLKKYSYTKEQVDETLLYYTHNNLDSLDLLYDKVFERLSVYGIEIE